MHNQTVLSLGISILTILFAGCQPVPRGALDALVDIGTHSLHIKCTGEGSPTILLDTGLGDTYRSWESLLADWAVDTRVCVYDRAGYGESDPGPMPRDSQREADELHQLLVNAGEEGPYLLLGHSLGAINMQVYASSYPDEVAAMLLVDPPPLGWLLGENFADLRQSFQQEVADMREGAESLLESAEAYISSPADFLLAVISEHEQLVGQSARQAADISSFGSIPLLVVGATEVDFNFGEPAETFRQYWNQESALLAEKSEDGRFIMAEGSSHLVHLDAPDLLLEAVREMLQKARE